MIGKITIGKSFRGCLMYCLNDKRKQHPDEVIFKNRAEIIAFNQCNGTAHDLIRQFNRLRQLNPNLSKPVLHISLSLSPEEHLSKDKLMQVAEQCAKDFGFENNQYVSVLHKDTEHQHMHIIANRIGFDKKTVSDSNSYKRVASFCREMELKLNLRQVLSPRKYLSQEQRLLPRSDERKKVLALAIRNAISNSKDIEHFTRMMHSKGYKVIKSRGISFIDNKKVKIKGSEVGYSLQQIEQRLELQHQLKNDKEFFKQVIQRKPMRQPTQAINHTSIKDENLSIRDQVKHNISETLHALLKPEQMPEQINPKLLVKKKERKKKRGLHL